MSRKGAPLPVLLPAPVVKKKKKENKKEPKRIPKKAAIHEHNKNVKIPWQIPHPPPPGRYIKHLPPRTEQVVGTGLTGTGKAKPLKHRPGRHGQGKSH